MLGGVNVNVYFWGVKRKWHLKNILFNRTGHDLSLRWDLCG